MRRFVYILVISICLFPSLIKASECSNEDRARLQKFADNVTYTLEEYQKDGETYFKATFAGLSKELKIFSQNEFLNYYNGTDSYLGDVSDSNLLPGETYDFQIRGSNVCYYEKIQHITISTPSINPYYEDAICENAKEYKLCQKWEKLNISYEEFIDKVNKYIVQKQGKPNDKPNIENNKNSFDFFEIYNKYYWPTFIGMICLLILLIILWIKQNKKNKL